MMAIHEISTPAEVERIEAILRASQQAEERTKRRDQFAAAALTGLLAEDGDRCDPHMKELCARAFEWADSMLEARSAK